MNGAYALAKTLAAKIKSMPNVSGVYIPQNLDYPGLALNIDRERASLIGLSAKEVVDNVITAMTSDGMVAPSYWIDPKTGNNYMVTVQYAEPTGSTTCRWRTSKNIPLRGTQAEIARCRWQMPAIARLRRRPSSGYMPLSSVADIQQINTPTEVDHYQIRRVIDIYVATKTEALQNVGREVSTIAGETPSTTGIRC